MPVGQLQFEVVAFRLQDEYGVECAFENVNVYTARWIAGAGSEEARGVQAKAYENLAVAIIPEHSCISHQHGSICS